MRCLAWVAARAGLGTDARAGRRHRAPGAAIVDARPATPTAPWSRPTSTWARSPSATRTSRSTLDGVEYWGDAANVGNPHLVCFVDRPRAGAGRAARPAHRARRPVPAPHQRRVRRACTRPTSSTCGSGNGASARRCRAAPARARRPPSRTTGVSSTTCARARARRRAPGHARRHGPARRPGRARLRRRHRSRRGAAAPPAKQTS